MPVHTMLYGNNKKIGVHVNCTDSFNVAVNKLCLKQVVMNLAANAVKFVDAGEIRIGCRCMTLAEVLLWVKDTSDGIQVNRRD